MFFVRLLCAGVAVLLSLNTLTGELVFDDRAAIVENKDLLPSSPWSNLLWHDFWGDPLTHNKSHKSFRPLSSATFKLNYHFHQLDVTGYHLVNVLLNGIVCYLYVQLCELIFRQEVWSTAVAGLLFATHPLHTEAVASVVGRTELLCSLFFLLSLLAYHKAAVGSQNGIGLKWLALSMAFCLCSFLSKEQGITSLAVCLFYEIFVLLKMDRHSIVHLVTSITSHPKTILKAQKRFIARALVVTLFVLVITVSRVILMQGAPKFSRSDNPGQTLPTPYRQLYYLHLVFVNLWLLLNPSRLVHDWRFGFIPSFDSLLYTHHLQTLLTFVSLLLFTYYSTIKKHNNVNSHTPAKFGLSLMTVTFLPASNLFFLVGFVVAERVLYLPSMGFCILIAFGATTFTTSLNRPFLRMATKAALLFLILSYSAKTLSRNTKWLSGQNLYIEALKLNREDGLMYSNLGYSFESSNPVLAEAAHKVAVQMSPNFSQPFRNYGALLMRQGRYAEAEKMFQRATKILGRKEKARSKSVETYQSLAYVISMNESRIPEALSFLEVALSMKPNVLDLLNMKGYFLHKMDRPSESVAVLRSALKTHPENKDTLYQLGIAYSKLGEMQRAEEVLRQVIQLDSTSGRAMLRLGLILAKKDPSTIEVLVEAGKYLRTVLSADSNHINALYGMGLVFNKLNKLERAEEYFLRVLELDPLHPDTMLDLGYLHYSRKNFTEVVRLMKGVPHSLLFSTQEYVQVGSMLVNSHLQLSHLKEAEELFKIMLHQDSLELQVDALNGLGELRLKSGEYLMAKEYFNRTLKIDHHNQLAIKRIDKLNSLLQT